MSRTEEIILFAILCVAILFIFFCGWIWPVITDKIKEKRKKDMIQSVDENSDLYFLHQKTDSECTPEFPEELNQKICRIVGQESYRPSKIFQRQVIKFNINDKNNRKGHTLSSRSVNVSMFLSYFENKPDYRFLEISVKENLGVPVWDGSKMHEDYNKCHTVYYAHLHEFESVWNNILDCLYGIKKHELKNID